MHAFHATINYANGPYVTSASNGGTLQSEMIQQIVLFALSSFGIQGKSSNVLHSWFLDFCASNQMVSSSENLHYLRYFYGKQKIQIVYGNNISITNVGDINSNSRHVLVSHDLAFNFLYVG